MPRKQLIVANDVREAARSGGHVILLRDASTLVTAEARGVARDLKVELRLAEPAPVQLVAPVAAVDEAVVRRAVVAHAGGDASEAVIGEVMRRVALERARPQDASIRKIASISDGAAAGGSQAGGQAGAKVSQLDLAALLDGSAPPRAAGFMALAKGFYPFARAGDEVHVVLEGEFQLRVAQEVIEARAGDVVLIPGGARVEIGTRSSVRLFYVSYSG